MPIPLTINTLTKVPDEAVEEITRDFKSEGATVTRKRESDGTWSISGIFEGEIGSQMGDEDEEETP